MYLWEPASPTIKPPKLWCGWRLSPESILKTALDRFPRDVFYNQFTGKPDLYQSVTFGTLLSKVRETCQIPDEDEDLLRLVEVVRVGGGGPDRKRDTVLSVGSTTEGIMAYQHVQAVANIFAEGVEPEWHLDPFRWYWARVCES